MIHWPSYNQSLVRRGEILFAYDFLDMWDDNLDKMNENKKGKPYSFPDSFLLIIGYMRIYFHLPCRQTEGIIKVTKDSSGSSKLFTDLQKSKQIGYLFENLKSSLI